MAAVYAGLFLQLARSRIIDRFIFLAKAARQGPHACIGPFLAPDQHNFQLPQRECLRDRLPFAFGQRKHDNIRRNAVRSAVFLAL